MPTGHEIDQGHWDDILEYIGRKAREDGIVEEREMIDLMRQYWHFISDPVALAAELDSREQAEEADEIRRLRARLEELEGPRGAAPARG